jgi:hypothetical protein
MPTLSWYARRLRRMSPAEIGWRGRSALGGARDRLRFALRLNPSLLTPGRHSLGEVRGAAALCALAPGAWGTAAPASLEGKWATALIAHADDIAAHRFSFLNLDRVDLGKPMDWNRDHETGTASPRGFAGSIDYRNPRVAGDAKLVWEPNRHLHLPVLGRAYRATGDTRYVRAALDQLDSWMQQCPVGSGMNWRSPLELAIRAINWTWFITLAEPSGLIAGDARARLLHALDLHVQEIARKYSRGSSANNHRIGEAAGVFIATSCFAGLTGAAALRDASRQILVEEIAAQHHPDGGNREQAFGYHLFVLQFLLFARFVASRTGQTMPVAFDERLRQSIGFAEALLEGGPAPLYGDADEGYVLDLGGRSAGGPEIVAAGRTSLGLPLRDFERSLEPVQWLMPERQQASPILQNTDPAPPLASQAFAETGLYLLQWGRPGDLDSASVTFDCGDLGFGAIAAHGHADALGVTLRAFGRDVLVDPGTYDYFRYPAWRDYFRSTRAHNTVAVDDRDQSVMLGPFMWGQRAHSRCLEWTAEATRARVVGEHDGYGRLTDPVLHRRAVEMDARTRTFDITDRLLMERPHRIALFFHTAEDARVTRAGDRDFVLEVDGGSVALRLDPQLTVQTFEGSDAPIGGWVSRGYHRKSPSVTIAGTVTARGPLVLRSRIRVQPGASR